VFSAAELTAVPIKRFGQRRVFGLSVVSVGAAIHVGLDGPRPRLRFGLGVKRPRLEWVTVAPDLGAPELAAFVKTCHCSLPFRDMKPKFRCAIFVPNPRKNGLDRHRAYIPVTK